MFSKRYNPNVDDDNETNNIKLNKFPFKRKREADSSSEEEEDVIDKESSEESDDIEIENEPKIVEESQISEDALKLEDSSSESSSEDSELEEKANDPSAANSEEDHKVIEDTKHTNILKRFKQTVTLKDDTEPEESQEKEEIEELHDLGPIPQPEKTYLPKVKRNIMNESWSHLNKIYYTMEDAVTWDDIYKKDKLINKTIYENITNSFNFDKTMPIQTVILKKYLKSLKKNYSISKQNYTLKSGDVLVNSFTGSGKTLSYLIPIIEILMNRKINKLRCIIVLPTQILIQQVYLTLNKLIKNSNLIITTTKANISLKEEIEKFKNLNMDILITTPGRLVDHLVKNSISLDDLKFLVLDESDKLLNQNYQDWLNIIMKNIKSNIIKFIVSATLTKNIEKLNLLKLNPIRTNLFLMKDENENNDNNGVYQLPRNINEYSLTIKFKNSIFKPLYLKKLIEMIVNTNKENRILIFVNSNQSSLKLYPLLKALLVNYNIFNINNNNTKLQNKQNLQSFNALNNTILITTDLMSRGIDLNITSIINYNIPISSQQYVHRIGRTSRGIDKNIGNIYNIFIGNDDYKFFANKIEVNLKRFDIDNTIPIIQDGVKDVVENTLNSDTEVKEYNDILKSFT
ncbi:ATP-dependent RNA helicase HuDBP6 [Hanseniaspora uvarum DSM 2768]|nr:ATP-dependent RNA helicase HuDBP6 [Hanseniaspora uvarum DSM 2768]